MKKLSQIFLIAIFAGLLLSGCEDETVSDRLAVSGGGGGPSDPTVPAGVNATASGTAITITWSLVSGAIDYRVYRDTVPGVNTGSTLIGTVPDPTNTKLDSGLPNGTTYYYVVTSFDGSTESPISAVVNDITIPVTPAGVGATTGDSQVTLAWGAVTGAASYNVYWSDSTNAVTTVNGIQVANGGSITFNHTGLVNFADYFYIVTAVNTTGESAPSAVKLGRPLATLSACPGGLDLTSSINGNPVDCSQGAGSIITYTLTNGSGSAKVYEVITALKPPSPGDINVSAYDPFSTLVADSWFLNPFRDSVIITVPAGDTYDLDMDESGGNTANYTIEVNEFTAPGGAAGSISTECNTLNNNGDTCGGGSLFYMEGINGDSGILLVSTEAETTNIAFKIDQTATANSKDGQDGRRNIGVFNTDHPASEYCRNLTQNGFSDWYLPSDWELHHLKVAIVNGFVSGITMGTGGSPTFFWSSQENSGNPAEARQIVFDGNTGSFFFTNWVKDSAAVNDRATCIRRPIL